MVNVLPWDQGRLDLSMVVGRPGQMNGQYVPGHVEVVSKQELENVAIQSK